MEEEISKEVFQDLLQEKFGNAFSIQSIEKTGSGYHSDGFKITTKDQVFFMKKFKSHDLGFAYPERKVFSLLVSQAMGKRSSQKPSPLGVVLVNKKEGKKKAMILPEIRDDTEIYHIQEFASGGDSYYSMLQKRKEKLEVDATDHKEIDKIVSYLASLHAQKYPSSDSSRLKEMYNDGIRSVLSNPELTLMLLHDFDEHSPLLDRNAQKEYLGLMYDVIHRWKNRSDRLCALHGDFWGTNFFLREDGSTWVADYSRIPWADPGIDVGWWLAQYLWFYHETRNPYFKELGELFLQQYERKTGDKEIRSAVALAFGFLGLVYIFPKFYPQLDIELGKRFIAHVMNILDKGRFTWE